MLIVLCQAISTPSCPLQIIDHQYGGGLLHFWILLKLKLENYAPTGVKEWFHSHLFFCFIASAYMPLLRSVLFLIFF